MKRCQSLLICALSIFSTCANSSGTRPLPPFASRAAYPAAPTPGVDFNSQTTLSMGRLRGASTTQSNFADFSDDMVKDIRATSVFVQEQAIKAGTPNGWLIALAAFGLVILQLRRKHKSLPQRRIAPYG
jgi:hypothetical protein